MSFQEDLERSARRFSTIVWPSLRKALGGGQLVQIEQADQIELARELDCTAGIDAWVRYGGDLYGIACRVQETAHPFDTFTIRKARTTGNATEYEKRIRAIDNDALFPHLTVQAYVTDDPPRCGSLAVIRTRELYRYARNNLGNVKTRSSDDGNEFLVLPWRDLMGHTKIKLAHG